MFSSSPRRGRHRKRISTLRLSDSSVTPLPAYTSPIWSKPPELHGDVSDRPPDYSDSAEEADADTDSDEDNVVYVPAPLPITPRRARRQLARSSTTRRLQSTSDDPYLDSLLARSVHALEMSNALLQSSMSAQSSLSAVLGDDSLADRSLEVSAQHLSSRINGNRTLHNYWMNDLDQISRSVDNLVSDEPGEESARRDPIVSRSLPSSTGFAEHVRAQGRQMRRPSLDLHSTSSSHLQYSNHERSHFIAPAPRALTMYIDSSDSPDLISLPSTLGLRSSHLPPTPLPSSESVSAHSSDQQSMEPVEQTRRAADVLSSYITRSFPSRSSTFSSFTSARLPASAHSRPSSRTSSYTIRPTQSKSPPPPVSVTSPSSVVSLRSRSLTPLRTTSSPRIPRPMTPPIEELSTSSTSDSSEMHVDRTVEALRNILDKQCSASSSASPSRHRPSLPPTASADPRPAFLLPPSVAPMAGTSTATASVSRLFTKARHSSSTRPPSPPRQSSLKNRSSPPTPISSSSSLLSVPDLFSAALARTSTPSSGRSTPKRISFAELPESYASSKPDGTSQFKGKGRAKARSREKGKGKGKGKTDGPDESAEGAGWWTGWLMGAAGTGSASGLGLGAAREERFSRSTSWSVRPAYGASLEEWTV